MEEQEQQPRPHPIYRSYIYIYRTSEAGGNDSIYMRLPPHIRELLFGSVPHF